MDLSVAIVGSGFSGIGLAINLRKAGVEDFAVLERGDGVGGTWHYNTYPGCACDVPSNLYSFSFAPNPDWSRTYSPQPEIHAYLRRVVDDFGIAAKIRLNCDVRHARWDGETCIEVVEVIGESPAGRAGIRPEDLILEVDGTRL